MKSMKHHIHSFFQKPEFWGLTSVGERGQVVIPAGTRKRLDLKKGDKLVVITRGEKFIGMVKAEEITGFLKKWLLKLEKLEGKNAKQSD